MLTVERSQAQNAWTTITARVTTPAGHACVLAAQRDRSRGPAALVAEYRRLRDAGTFDSLNRLRLSAGQIADLAIVVNGGPRGVNAHRLDGNVRTSLARHRLIEPVPGTRWPAHDWRATVCATLSGVACVRAAQGRPVQLSPSDVVALAVIERAMAEEPEHGGAHDWPGSALALRVAQLWRLVEYVRQPAPPAGEHWSTRNPVGRAVYRLTDTGRLTLERHRRRGSDGADVDARTAGVLSELARLRQGGVDPATLRQAPLQRCLDAGWVERTERVAGTRRYRVRLTDAGRDALAGWKFRQETATREATARTIRAPQLAPGMWVRLSNRKRFPGIGNAWVQVHEVRHTDDNTGGRLRHNYEVWVTSDAEDTPYVYAGQAHFRTVAFEVRPL